MKLHRTTADGMELNLMRMERTERLGEQRDLPCLGVRREEGGPRAQEQNLDSQFRDDAV